MGRRIRGLSVLCLVSVLAIPVMGQGPRATLLPPFTEPGEPKPRFEGKGFISHSPLIGIEVENPRPGSEGERVTLTDLENWALKNNPTIAQARALVEEERGLYQQVGLYPNPLFGYLRSDPSQSPVSQTQGMFFSQEIVTPGKLRLNRAMEAQSVNWREWQLEAQKGRVLNDIRISFYETLGAQRSLELARELEKLAAEAVQIFQKAFQKAGVVSRTDVALLELQHQAAQAAVRDFELRYRISWQQLVNMAGRPDLAPVWLEGNLETNIPNLGWEQTLDFLLQNSPILRAQEAQVREAEFAWRRARLEAVPNLTVQVVAQHDSIQKFNSVSTLLALPVPIFNRNQGNVYNAAANIQHQKQELERLRLTLRDLLANTFNQYLSAKNHAERYKKEILPRAKEVLDLTFKKVKVAMKDSAFLLIEARKIYFEQNLAYINALTDLHKTGIEISGMLLTGGLNPTEVGTALQMRGGMTGPGIRGLLLQQSQEQGTNRLRTLPGSIQGSLP